MSDALVIDASVAIKWVVDEDDGDRALKLLADAARLQHRIFAPAHFPGEVGNGIYQRVRSSDPSKHLDFADAEEALARFLTYPVEVLQTPPALLAAAFAFAHTHGLVGIYDALYVVLARELDAELWTVDGRLLTQLAGRASWVRPLRDYPV